MNILPYNKKGTINLILGPMFSGKTTKLIEIYREAQFCNINTIVINHKLDTRYSNNKLSNHDREMIPCIFLDKLYDMKQESSVLIKIMCADVILINEGQFFSDLKAWVLELCETYNKKIYISGLDGDYKRDKIGTILDLIPYCDSVEKYTSFCSYCKNGTKGLFTHRLSKETEQICVGSDNYIPLCRKCYIENTR